MERPARTEVLIVGAGPTGLMAALELARQGVRCRIIDCVAHPASVSKALCVQARTLEYFDRLGIATEAVRLGRPMVGMHLFSNRDHIGSLRLDGIASRYNFILILPQFHTERLLIERLQHEGVRVEWNTRLLSLTQDQHGVVATIDQHGTHQQVHALWLVGCDGAHSLARHQVHASFQGHTLEESFAVADVQLDWDGPRDAYSIYLHTGRIVVLFPLADDQYRIAVATHEPHASPNEHADEFQHALDSWGPTGASIRAIHWSSRFRVNQRQVAHYRHQRVLLAGDAAHIHSPIGGQGMNTGIQDAINLAWKLALVIRGAAAPRLLDSYEAERKPLGTRLLWATEAITRITLSRHPLVHRVRDAVIRRLLPVGAVQDSMQRAVSQTGISYRTNLMMRGLHRRSPFRAGERAMPLPLDTKHLLLHETTRSSALDIARREYHHAIAFQQTTHQLHGDLVLIRPDGYVALRCRADDVAALRSYMTTNGFL